MHGDLAATTLNQRLRAAHLLAYRADPDERLLLLAVALWPDGRRPHIPNRATMAELLDPQHNGRPARLRARRRCPECGQPVRPSRVYCNQICYTQHRRRTA